MTVKLAKNIPDPPEITEEDLERMRKEADAWRKSFTERVREMENLTAEDWAAVAR